MSTRATMSKVAGSKLRLHNIKVGEFISNEVRSTCAEVSVCDRKPAGAQ
jgi:hypothetical protein